MLGDPPPILPLPLPLPLTLVLPGALTLTRYDEGACFAPAALRPSVLISHWGNTMSAHNRCTTTYDPDR